MFPAWQHAYDAVLQETDRSLLFLRIEVAESAIRIRLDAIRTGDANRSERNAIADAITHLDSLKRRLGFQM